jgi:hypothetical protein
MRDALAAGIANANIPAARKFAADNQRINFAKGTGVLPE